MSALRRFVRSRAVADNDRRLEECLANTETLVADAFTSMVDLVLRKPPQLPQHGAASLSSGATITRVAHVA